MSEDISWTAFVIAIAVWAFIVAAHGLGFVAVYRWVARSKDSGRIVVGGAAAGLVGWFWACVIMVGIDLYFDGRSNGMLVIIWVYGIILTWMPGMGFTTVFWLVLRWLEVPTGLLARGLFGAIVGFVLAIFLGWPMDNLLNGGRYAAQHGMLNLFLFLFVPISFFSAIMAGAGRSGKAVVPESQ